MFLALLFLSSSTVAKISAQEDVLTEAATQLRDAVLELRPRFERAVGQEELFATLNLDGQVENENLAKLVNQLHPLANNRLDSLDNHLTTKQFDSKSRPLDTMNLGGQANNIITMNLDGQGNHVALQIDRLQRFLNERVEPELEALAAGVQEMQAAVDNLESEQLTKEAKSWQR